MRVAEPYELPAGPARTRRPSHPRRLRPGEPYTPETMVPIEAAGHEDTQILIARFPGRPREPVIAIDGLAQAPQIDSLIVSTEIQLSRPLPSVHELLLPRVTPVPSEETLTNLPGLHTLYAPSTMTVRTLALRALPAGLADLTAHRASLGALDDLGELSGLRSLQLTLYPGDSVAAIGRLAELVRLRIDGLRATGWRALAGCGQLEEVRLKGLTGANLRPYAGWTRLRRLSITGRGMRSLTGLDNLTALEELDLELLEVEDLGPLAALSGLRSLNLVGLRAAHDLSPLAGLRNLERVRVARAGMGDDVHVASVRPLAALDRLEEVVLSGTVIDDGDLSPVAELPRLRKLVIYQASGPVVENLRARPGLELIEYSGASAPAATVHGLPIRQASDKSWYLRADLTDRLRVETNFDAEGMVREAVTGRSDHLGRRLSFDTEAGAVEISAADLVDLRAVAAVIESLS